MKVLLISLEGVMATDGNGMELQDIFNKALSDKLQGNNISDDDVVSVNVNILSNHSWLIVWYRGGI